MTFANLSSVLTPRKLDLNLHRRRTLVHCVVCPFKIVCKLALIVWPPLDACKSLDIVSAEPMQEPRRGSPCAALSHITVPSGPVPSTASKHPIRQYQLMVCSHNCFMFYDTFAQLIIVIRISVSLAWCKCTQGTCLPVITVYIITSNSMFHNKGTQEGDRQKAVSSVGRARGLSDISSY